MMKTQNENRPGYKKTKVGWIPEEWEKYKISNIANIGVGKDLREESYSKIKTTTHLYPVYSNTVSNGGAYGGFYDFEEYKSNSLTVVGRGIGLGTAFARKSGFGAIGRLLVISPKNNNFDVGYFAEYVNSKLRIYNESGGIPQLPGTAFENYLVFLPPLPEQKAIAGVLKCWDRGIRNLELKIENKRRTKKGLMQRLLSGKLRLPEFKNSALGVRNGELETPKGWKSVKLGEVALIKKGKQLNRLNQTEIGKYPVLNGGVKPLGYTDKWNTKENTITVSEGGNSCGFVNFNKEKFWCGGHCYALAENKSVLKNYLFQNLKHNEISIMRLRVGSGLPNIQKKELEQFKLILPPLDEQQAIAKVLSAADGEIEVLERKLATWKDQKKFLLNNLVTGSIRLPEFRTTN